MARIAALRDRLGESLWIVPVVGLLLAMALTVITIRIDREVEVGSSVLVGFDGGPDSARSILSTIAASMLTFLGLVFTLTVVALQLATQFSPRLLRNFLAARVSKLALAIFVATFTYAVLVLREVSPAEVPELSVTVAIVLVIISVVIFVYYLNEVAQSVRVASLVERVGAATREEIEIEFTDFDDPGAEEEERSRGWDEVRERQSRRTVAWEDEPGVVTAIDLDGIRDLAHRRGGPIELFAQVGDFLPGGAPVVALYGSPDEIEASELHGLIATAKERTFSQDAAFGLRQLADIGAKALSPGVNDPTTAVQALDQLQDLLLRLGVRRLYSGVLRDDQGRVQVLVPVHTWDDYVHLAIDEIRIYGEGSMQVSRRLQALLEDLRDRLPPTRIEPVQRQLELHAEAIARGFADRADRERAKLTTTAVGGAEGGG